LNISAGKAMRMAQAFTSGSNGKSNSSNDSVSICNEASPWSVVRDPERRFQPIGELAAARPITPPRPKRPTIGERVAFNFSKPRRLNGFRMIASAPLASWRW
jgi:hypothetical protein